MRKNGETLVEKKERISKEISMLEKKFDEVKNNPNFILDESTQKTYEFYLMKKKENNLPDIFEKDYKNEKDFYIRFVLSSKMNSLKEQFDSLNQLKPSPVRHKDPLVKYK
ncbi:MAG: hypothetical protein KC516_04510 [Nanoarchaeota archaeon]|nr:hypothetical protein [Nanoarchaeota archaeon]